MSTQAKEKFFQNLEDALKKANRNKTCLYPGCSRKPIASHVISRKTLELIAEKSHILTWLTRKVSTFDMAKTIEAGKSLEQLFAEPIRVGIGDKNKVTYPLFCQEHDDRVFAPLDTRGFSFQPEQVALLAYRALCAMILGPSITEAILTVAKQYGYQHSLNTTAGSAKLQRFLATELVLNVRQLYAQIQSANDYDKLGWSMYLVNMQPCVAATYALIPVDNDGDAKAIIDGTQTLTVEDAVSFSFLPYKPLHQSICVISWLKDSPRAKDLMTLNRVNELSEQEQQDLFLTFAFQSPNIFISPSWWESLTEEKREEYKQIHLNTGREHAALI